MPVKLYKPTTPARRHTSVVDTSELSKERPLRSLVYGRKSKAGRSHGTVSVRHRGAGVKRLIRVVDFKRQKYDIPATIASLEYDPNRSAWLALLNYADGTKTYIIAPHGVAVGEQIMSSEKLIDIKTGNRMPLHFLPAGMPVHNIELTPGGGAKVARAAGGSVMVMGSEGAYSQLRLPSGEIRLVPKMAMATVGNVSNPDRKNVRWGKAGRMRHRGIRPTVRGKAMNPVDHPHGGGEGHNPIGMKKPKTAWGKPAVGVHTRPKRASDRLIIKRRPVKSKADRSKK